MQAVAIYKNAKSSPQKTRLVANQIRGMNVENALNILNFSPKKAAKMIKKALMSAVANAEHNEGADIDDLVVSKICIDKSRPLKRYRARAKGRGTRIIKQYSHITVAVSDEKSE